MISSSEMSKPWAGRSSPQTATFVKAKKPFVKPFMPRLVRSKSPDHVIGYGSTIQGRFEFAGLLRVEGRFEGVLKPALGATVTVARSGVIVGDIDGCHSVVVEGTVVGNVTASLADLRRHAHVEGNVWCKDLVAAPTAAFRNRAAVTTAPTATTASANSRRRSSSSSRSSSGSFDAAEANASRAAVIAAAAAAAGAGASSSTSGSAAAAITLSSPDLPCVGAISSLSPFVGGGGGSIGGGDDSAGGPVSGGPAKAGVLGTDPRLMNDDVVANSVGLSLSVAAPSSSAPVSTHISDATAESRCSVMHQRALPRPPPPLPSRPRNHVRTVVDHSNGLSSGEGLQSESSVANENRCVLVRVEPPREHLSERDVGGDCGNVDEAEAEGEEEPCEVSGGQESMVTSSTEGPCNMTERFTGCPLSHGFQPGDSGSETKAEPEQRHVWRDCSKLYGVKCNSLTKAFSSVAVMLKFDEDLIFEDHLQMEYAAENLWFWKRGMKFRSRRFDTFESRRDEAKCIYDAFLAVEAPDQVNISHEDREDVLAALENRPGAQAIGSGLFDEALIQVENMLSMGPFPRFADSSMKNIEKSWRMVLESLSIEDVGETFYTVLFEIAPHFEGMFTRSKRIQGKMLMEIINSSVKLLKNLQDLVPILIQLGLRHNAYKVKAEHYPIVGDALVATLSLALGERLTNDVKQSWIAVYTLISNIMISMLDEEGSSLGGTEEVSLADSDASRLSSGARSVSAGSSSATGTEKGIMSMRRISSARVQPSGAGAGGGGTTASTVKGMYRRGTTSFRNRFSSFAFNRKDASNNNNSNDDPAPSRRHQPQTQPHLRQPQENTISYNPPKPSTSSTMPPLAPPNSNPMGASSSGSSSDSAAEVLLGGGLSRGGGRRQGGNNRVLLGLG